MCVCIQTNNKQPQWSNKSKTSSTLTSTAPRRAETQCQSQDRPPHHIYPDGKTASTCEVNKMTSLLLSCQLAPNVSAAAGCGFQPVLRSRNFDARGATGVLAVLAAAIAIASNITPIITLTPTCRFGWGGLISMDTTNQPLNH